jgi:hypothetical protein
VGTQDVINALNFGGGKRRRVRPEAFSITIQKVGKHNVYVKYQPVKADDKAVLPEKPNISFPRLRVGSGYLVDKGFSVFVPAIPCSAIHPASITLLHLHFIKKKKKTQ